jgi:hypothetical protein
VTKVQGESRWPMAAAVIFCIAISELRPAGMTPPTSRVLDGAEAVLLILLIVADPGRIDRRTTWLRRVALVLIGTLVLEALTTTARLVVRLIDGTPPADNATDLLVTGTMVWFYVIVVWALLFWEIDGGGSARRTLEQGCKRDFAFPQELKPDVADSDWRPRFSDYLYLGLTNALAFSPTDAMPLTRAGKVCMATESLTSLAILALVVARAVNVLQ